jgi:DNA-binding CsgD family transcriptional regulator
MSLAADALSPPERAALTAAEREGIPFLVHRDEHGDMRIVPLTSGDRVRLGRAAANDVVLGGDPEVSRAHAVLEPAGGGWTVVDDGLSRNGTFVNGERVTRQRRLEDRDVIRVGNTTLHFRYPAMVPDDTTAIAARLPDTRISPAERRVLVALCRPLLHSGGTGLPAGNSEIAAELFLSVPAVKSHIRSLFTKTGVDALPQTHKRVELARRAVQNGLVSARDL